MEKSKALKEVYFGLLSNYTNSSALRNEFWNRIVDNHTCHKRFYHTLEHLHNLLPQLQQVKSEIRDWNSVLFALYYHDIIYNATKSNNEAKSADFALEEMLKLNVDNQTVVNCKAIILATKKHERSHLEDINYFTDADLSILGADWKTYENYTQNVRKEYAMYPKVFYSMGRKKVLKHFLDMTIIFKTNYFSHRYEQQARINLNRELVML